MDEELLIAIFLLFIGIIPFWRGIMLLRKTKKYNNVGRLIAFGWILGGVAGIIGSIILFAKRFN